MKVDVSEIDTGKLDGQAYAGPGTYHLRVDDVIEENDRGHFEAHLTVLAGVPKDAAGLTHRETFFLTPKAIPRLVQFAVACKLTTSEEVERCKATGDELEIDWGKIVGRQFAGRLSQKKDQAGNVTQFCELGFNIWALDSKAAKGVVMDTAAAKAFLESVGAKLPPAASKATPAASKTAAKSNGGGGNAAPAASNASADPFGGGDDLFGG